MARAKLEAFDDRLVGLARFAKALSHPARIEILRRLAVTGEQPCLDVVAGLPLSQPACSRHINELLNVGLLESRTVGTQILFRLRPSALESFCGMMNAALHPAPGRRRKRSD